MYVSNHILGAHFDVLTLKERRELAYLMFGYKLLSSKEENMALLSKVKINVLVIYSPCYNQCPVVIRTFC